MDQIKIGAFIAACRREQNMTQVQFAEKLGVTNKAVSKWETGKCMPDASLFNDICLLLHITLNELFAGERIPPENIAKKAEENLIAMKINEENHIMKNGMISILFSAVLLLGILVCLICDIATSGGFTWSRISISSIIFAWVIFFPSIQWGKRGILASLLSFSLFVIPYLFLLSRFLKTAEVFSIGSAVAAASIVFLWMIAALFKRIWTARKLAALGTVFLLAIPFRFVIDLILSKMISQPIFDVWDMLSAFILLILAFACFMEYTSGK